MNEKAGSCDLDDDEIVDAELEVIELSDDEKLVNRKAAKVVIKTEKSGTGPVARRPASDCIHVDSTHSRARNSHDLLANISQVLDPNLRRARADDQSVTALQTGQIFTLSSQFWEAQRQAEALRNQLAEAKCRCHNAERRADRAELMEMISGSRGHQVVTHRPVSPGLRPHVGHRPCGGWGPRRRLRQEVYYADGGRSTQYLGSDYDEADIQGNNDSPGTRRYTFEDDDQPESPDRSLISSKPSCTSPPTFSSQDDLPIVPPKMERKATTPVSMIGSPLRYPSQEI
jgi:hypothetical protein